MPASPRERLATSGGPIWHALAGLRAIVAQTNRQRAVPRLTRATDCSLASPVPSLQGNTLIGGAGRFSPAASQEVKEIAVAQQFGAIFILLMAMENMQLIEKQAQA
jgi:hypothetical protein